MKAYKVTVNGTVYEITLEVVDKEDIKAPVESAPVQSAPVESAPATPVSAPAGGETISAPMPGTILKVNVTNGQSVKAGDDLFILEAMKMENEIKAPFDGVISSVSVTTGASVEAGTVLCTIA